MNPPRPVMFGRALMRSAAGSCMPRQLFPKPQPPPMFGPPAPPAPPPTKRPPGTAPPGPPGAGRPPCPGGPGRSGNSMPGQPGGRILPNCSRAARTVGITVDSHVSANPSAYPNAVFSPNSRNTRDGDSRPRIFLARATRSPNRFDKNALMVSHPAVIPSLSPCTTFAPMSTSNVAASPMASRMD